jgi:GNAT superfamily N-acetyltransferase
VDEAGLLERVMQGLAAEQRLMGTHPAGSWVIELPDVVASVAPSVPEYSLPNAAVVMRAGALTYDVIHALRSAYADAGVERWGAYLDPGDADSLARVAAAGMVFDSHPMPMGAELECMDLDEAPPTDRFSLKEAGHVSGLAFGHADDRLERSIGPIPDELVHTYGVRSADGETAAVVVVLDRDDDVAVWIVATVPWERNQGHAKRLLRRALADARERGCSTTTLIASELGAPVYAALGYRPLGAIHLWERRP